ncbi:indole-3-glycerol phosphate synthase TrpC [Parablautia muri]|uniref:Indole-3-glycerol phosphate synthase n=1 Tax=Parablautia muri TaxID=2320879 RepID=A0A9X5GQE2_9FIRM|nr:indole-3-glycerol phosphate synthase TrpC [Parablautia muri]NBJ91074.1 indole-3-glycerol phosphate synthase TrpC [Parablautia muri]
METILDTIAAYAKQRVEKAKEIRPLKELKQLAFTQSCKTGFPFEKALATGGISFICECKKASPSKGLIAKEFPYLTIAKEYEAAGASCISVLTEPKWFLGKDQYLKEISSAVSIPCIRKDFTVDEYMIYEAKLLGASAVLLICSLLSTDTLKRYIDICDTLGLSALVEAHNEKEIASAIAAGARMIGVNNRNLKNFTVDISNSRKLRSLVPEDIFFVAESGIRSGEDVKALEMARVDAILIGETLMRAPDKKAMLDELRTGSKGKMEDFYD